MSNPNHSIHQPLFDLGRVFITPGVERELARYVSGKQMLAALLVRHAAGDWGELDESDRRMNDRGVRDGNMILSQYRLNETTLIWIISDPADDAGQRVTTVLLPEER